MTDQHDGNSGSLWRWLVGGLAGGAAILGLLIAAYAVGYHRGEHHHTSAAAAPATTPSTTTASTSTAAAGTTPKSSKPGPVTVTPALLTRGKALYQSDGCSGCHSLTGAPGAGPTFKGLAEGSSQLTNGQTVSLGAVSAAPLIRRRERSGSPCRRADLYSRRQPHLQLRRCSCSQH